MNLITPDQLKTANELMEAEVNFALSSHPVDDGFLKVDLSAITMKFDDKRANELTELLCKKLESIGYHCYYSTYFTFVLRISIHISTKSFERVYFEIKDGNIHSHPFTFFKPYYGYLSKEEAQSRYDQVYKYNVGKYESAFKTIKKSWWTKLFME